jgi:TolB protein
MFNQHFRPTSLLTLALVGVLLLTQVFSPQPAHAEGQGQPGMGTLPALGADTSTIAYVSPSRENQQIRLVNPDGSNDRLLWQVPPNTERQHGIGELSWRSDASELAFDSGHDWHRSMYIRDLYAITPDGTQIRQLTRPPGVIAANTLPQGTVTFWLDSYTSGDVELYIEGAEQPITFFARFGYSYQITQTVADFGDNVRQHIRLYDANQCDYNAEGWVDVIPGQVTDVGHINFGWGYEYSCPQTLRPAWLLDRNELLYLFVQPALAGYQDETNIWRIPGDAAPTSEGTMVLDYSQYPLEGRLYLAVPGRTPETAEQLLGVVHEDLGTAIFQAPIADAQQRTFIDWGSCGFLCQITGLAWLPDGSGFVFALYGDDFSSGLDKFSGIYRYTFADQQLTELYSITNQAIGRLDVSPDGSQIVFEQSPQLDETTDNFWLEPILLCPCQVWIVNSDGTNAHLLVSDGRAPAWSPVAPN